MTDGHDALYQLATCTTYATDFQDITSLESPLANNLVPGLKEMNERHSLLKLI